MPDSERKAFKEYFDRDAAKALAQQLYAADKRFDRQAFVKAASRDLDGLEMMDRVRQFSATLHHYLPNSIPAAVGVIKKSFPPPLPNCDNVTDGYIQWPIGQFIAEYCVDYFDDAMSCMEELTQRFSAEFAVRPFVERYPDRTFGLLLKYTKHPSPHVRRWCSEGTRPRLPWGKRLDFLVQNPAPLLPLLERLKDDPEPYVQRSVANSLNDIAKDHPHVVVELCARWSRGANASRNGIIKHALRTLVKRGDPAALAVLGYTPPADLRAHLAITPRCARIGEKIELRLTLETTSTKPHQLLIDYRVHYVKAYDKTSAKVFKWTTTAIDIGNPVELMKQHSLRRTTTRTLHPGTHVIDVQVNGTVVANAAFDLQAQR